MKIQCQCPNKWKIYAILFVSFRGCCGFSFFQFHFSHNRSPKAPLLPLPPPLLKWKRKMQRKSMGSWLSWRMLDLSHITHTQWGTNCSQLDVAGCLKVFGTPYILTPHTRPIVSYSEFWFEVGAIILLAFVFCLGFSVSVSVSVSVLFVLLGKPVPLAPLIPPFILFFIMQ